MPEDTRSLRRWKSAAHRFFFDGDDTIAALILALLALGTLVAFPIALHSRNARGDVLKISGGLLVVFSAYSASRTLALNRLDQRTGRILQATEQLRSDSATVRSGGLWTLDSGRARNLEQVAARTAAAQRDRRGPLDRET